MEHLKVETTAFAITLSCQVVLFKKCNMEKRVKLFNNIWAVDAQHTI